MRAALCKKKRDGASGLKWEIVRYAWSNVTEICILENAWLDYKDQIFSHYIRLYFYRLLPSEIVCRILGMVETWRAVDARHVSPEFFKVELRKTRIGRTLST
ncbi:MAG: hypothetical protein CBC12_07590 [Candidatus Puniceispirillum sp. TMED52]|jgi:hypothetical protein|nr:MAG: hypothetical protein CBC12_07590 [Candidatus Puniceispirillum sp. TMED52]